MKLNRITALLMLSSAPMLANSASYTVVELPTKDLSSSQFASAIDDTGLILASVRQPYNPPIDLSLIDLEPFTLTDPDAAAQGNFNAIDLTIVSGFLYQQTSANNPFTQKLASLLTYRIDGDTATYVNGFDSVSDQLNGFTFAQEMTQGRSVNGSHIIGTMSGPFSEVAYTNDSDEELTYVINDFTQRGFVQVGDTVTALMPSFADVGGISNARAINENLQVAGLTSVAYSEQLQTQIDLCADETERGDQPEAACLFSLRNFVNSQGVRQFRASSQTRAIIWQLGNDGAVIDQTVYGLLFEPAADETRVFTSQALDINNNGVAVGTSSVEVGEGFTDAAVVFENGEVVRLLEDDDFLPNLATNINDNNIVVGYRAERINGVTRSKMFVLDRNSGDLDFPNGFFLSSTTIPRAINNNNLVVGDAESESVSGARRRSGFLYDIDTQTFTNLNDLLPCDSSYTIIAGNDINNSDVIVADALVERAARDITGEILLDADGNQVMVDTVVAVKLDPTGQEPSDCDPSDEEREDTERQGASLGFFTSIALLTIALFRRKGHPKK